MEKNKLSKSEIEVLVLGRMKSEKIDYETASKQILEEIKIIYNG